MAIFSTNFIKSLGLIAVLSVGAVLGSYGIKQAQAAPVASVLGADSAPHYIAHAGGRYRGKTYTNSVAALEHNYQAGYRHFEVDLNLTTDQRIVLLHDWNGTLRSVYGLEPGRRDYATFAAQAATSPQGVTRLEDLAAWVAAHPDTQILLDTKEDTVGLLTHVAERYPELRHQFVAYIYNTSQYRPIARLHFGGVSLLVHNGQYSPAELLEFASGHTLNSIALPTAMLEQQDPMLWRYARIYCWTVNDAAIARRLQQNHVSAIVTDDLGGR